MMTTAPAPPYEATEASVPRDAGTAVTYTDLHALPTEAIERLGDDPDFVTALARGRAGRAV